MNSLYPDVGNLLLVPVGSVEPWQAELLYCCDLWKSYVTPNLCHPHGQRLQRELPSAVWERQASEEQDAIHTDARHQSTSNKMGTGARLIDQALLSPENGLHPG